MNFKLQLTRRELDLLISFITDTYPVKRVGNFDKLIEACLAEMLKKLKLANVLIKEKYQISISYASGFGFVEHCTRTPSAKHQDKAITVNKVVGIIDQKSSTKI